MKTKQAKSTNLSWFWGLLRLAMGWTFLWAFIDKLFGLWFATCREAATNLVSVMCEKAWLLGGSPTTGFLKFAAQGPFVDFFNSLAGNPIIDWLFMLGLLFAGATLFLGVLVKLGSYAGALMFLLMYLALIGPENNPFLDDHIIYAIVLLGLAASGAGAYFGFGKKWQTLKLVRANKILE